MTMFGSWHDKLLTLAAGCFQWLAFCFCSSWSNEHLGKASSIPTIFSWGDSISPGSSLPSILLLLVIIVAIVIFVMVILVVVVGEGWANEFHQDKASSVRVPVANFTLQSSMQLLRENTDSVRSNQRMRPTTPSVPLNLKVFAMVAAYASRAVKTLSTTSFLMAT
ncbi:hypothetical protein Tco_1161885 [Tanacetum coccineum]